MRLGQGSKSCACIYFMRPREPMRVLLNFAIVFTFLQACWKNSSNERSMLFFWNITLCTCEVPGFDEFFFKLMQISSVILSFDKLFWHVWKCGTVAKLVKTITVQERQLAKEEEKRKNEGNSQNPKRATSAAYC